MRTSLHLFTTETARKALQRKAGLGAARYWRARGFENLVKAREALRRKLESAGLSNSEYDSHLDLSEEKQRELLLAGHLVGLGWTNPARLSGLQSGLVYPPADESRTARPTRPRGGLDDLTQDRLAKSEPQGPPTSRLKSWATSHRSEPKVPKKLVITNQGWGRGYRNRKLLIAMVREVGIWEVSNFYRRGLDENGIRVVPNKKSRRQREKQEEQRRAVAVTGKCDWCGEEVTQKFRHSGTVRLYHAGKCRASGEKHEHDVSDWLLLQALAKAGRVLQHAGLQFNWEIVMESYPGDAEARRQYREFSKWIKGFVVEKLEDRTEELPTAGGVSGLHTAQHAVGSIPSVGSAVDPEMGTGGAENGEVPPPVSSAKSSRATGRTPRARKKKAASGPDGDWRRHQVRGRSVQRSACAVDVP